jgi:methylated-DNA-[protein]-cysteine S-methyltransferase
VARPHQTARARYGEERKQTVTATAGSTAATAHAVIETRLGPITLVRTGAHLTGLYFPRHWPRPDRAAFGPRAGDDCAGNAIAGNAVASDGVATDVFAAAARQLGEYLDGDRAEFELPVRVAGTEFEERVWALVAGIPYGQTTSYGELARRLGAGTDPRDVGAAVGRNPLCIVIPCHRVVGATGKLTGYAGGLSRKRALLEIEQARLVQPEPAAAAGLW